MKSYIGDFLIFGRAEEKFNNKVSFTYMWAQELENDTVEDED